MDANVLLHEALSPQERYARELEKLLAQVDRLEDQAVRRVMEILTEARRRIIATLAEVSPDSFLAAYLPRLQVEVERTMADYVDRYQRVFTDQSAAFWDLGVASIDRPLQAVGAVQLISQLPALEPRYLDILQGYQADLITNVSNQAISRITAELQLGVLGGKTPFEMQRSVADILRTQPDPAGVFHGIAARAEAITRTELNRTFSLATVSRQQQFQTHVQAVFPELQPQKVWMTAKDDRVRPSHRRMEGQTVSVDGEFTLVGADGVTYKIQGPHDARLPAAEATHCRCRSVIAVDSLLPVLESI